MRWVISQLQVPCTIVAARRTPDRHIIQSVYCLRPPQVSGTSKLLMRTAADPSVLRKSISTPGGSTITGLAALQRCGLE